MGSTFCISPSISTEQQFFINMIKSNQLEITTRDAGASGLHSNAEHWNEETRNCLFYLIKIYHIVMLLS